LCLTPNTNSRQASWIIPKGECQACPRKVAFSCLNQLRSQNPNWLVRQTSKPFRTNPVNYSFFLVRFVILRPRYQCIFESHYISLSCPTLFGAILRLGKACSFSCQFGYRDLVNSYLHWVMRPCSRNKYGRCVCRGWVC
jgi:hypothetical protein